MERLRRKRSTSNTNPDYASQGNGRIRNSRNHPKPASDSSSCSSGIFPDDDSFTLELGLRCSRQTPMKKLLAKEMSESASMRRKSCGSPGVVAKLMGLEALPCPSSSRKEHFKDVFEVVESRPDMAFIRQKFMDAKRLSADHHSREFHEALDALDSNKDLLLKFLQHPDSLFAHHLRVCHNDPLCARLSSVKHRQPHTSVTLSSSDAQPTRIVVLKPNLGKPSDYRKDREIPLVRKREVEVSGRRKCHRDSRELAKEITRQMRNSFGNSSARLSSAAAFKGYAGDESSCSMSGNESANELDQVASTSSKYSFDLSNRSRSAESSVSREAKKRLSERWRLNHRSQDMRAVSRGNTLADMLAISDKEKIAVHLDNGVPDDADGFRNKSCRHVDRQQPLGISSRDGWKDGCIANLTRSRSLPSSSIVFGSPRAVVREDRYVVVKEAYKRERSRGQKTSFDKKSVDRSLRSNSATSFPSPFIIRESGDTSPKTHSMQNQVEAELKVNSQEKKLEVIESLSYKPTTMDVEAETTAPSVALDNSLQQASMHTLVPDVCNEGDRDSSNSLQELPTETKPREESPLPMNHSVPGLESPAASKEADQPSPVSVLAAPFTDDLSSCSDCFESLNADLQGLRMQLQLLKLESESSFEGPTVLSSDEDTGEGSVRLSLCKSQQSWEFCYIGDALFHSGLDDSDPDVFMAAWHAPECPISPWVFEKLEKENYEETTQPKSERRLLFDRINHAILDMYRQFADPHPWVRSSTTAFAPRWSANELQDGLFQLLASQEKNAKKDTAEKVLGSKSQWLDIRDDVEVIGGDIEKLLYDELVGELVGM